MRPPPQGDGPLRVALTSLGCKVNYAEMAELAGQVAAAGCEVVPEHEPADVRVLNSCTVTLQADATTRQRLARLRRDDPGSHIILTGCSVDGNPDRHRPGAVEPGSPHPADMIVANAAKAGIAGLITSLAADRGPATAPRPAAALRSRAFLKVQDGCDHRCTYCAVWRARGAAVSVPVNQVLSRARTAAAQGHAEIVLCGVDLGSYGRDHGTRLARLLELLLDEVPSVRFRLSSVNANDVGPDLIAVNRHRRLCPHWHLPLQSGSDAVLRAMHRGYRRAQYLRVVEGLREADPLTELTTDVMVGFPGETREDHLQTISLIETVGFLGCHVFRHSARPGTPANALPGRVDDGVARRRSAEVRRAAALATLAAQRRAVGRVHEVVWDRVEADAAHGIAATYHAIVAPPGPRTATGRLERVRAGTVEADHLRATVMSPSGDG